MSQAVGQLRLADGVSSTSGRLEVFLDDDWGTVCRAGFTAGAAQASCRQLGYADYLKYGTVDTVGSVCVCVCVCVC